MKKVISLILTVIFSMAFCCVPKASFSENTEGNCGILLYKLGILKSEADIGESSGIVTRGEFAAMLVAMSKSNDMDMTGYNTFSDVKSNNPYKNEIETAYCMGLVNGKSENRFAPDAPVTTEEAATLLVKILGYGIAAEKNGGYPKGYLSVGYSLRLFDGVKAGPGEIIRRKDVFRLIENALETDILNEDAYTSSGDIDRSITKGKTLLTEKMKIAHYSGIVNKNYLTSLTDNDGIKMGVVEISGTEYNELESGASEMLGCSVDYYVTIPDRSGDNPDILYIYPSERNKTLTIDIRDLTGEKLSLKNNTVTYKTDKSKKTVKQISPYADYIYNGVRVDASELAVLPENGKIELIDNNNDGKTEVVSVISYKTIIVDGISQTNLTVYDKYTKEAVNLDTDKNKNIVYISKDGSREFFRNIKKWSVLSVSESVNKSGYRCVKALHSREFTDGTLEAKDDDYITVNSTEYKISADVKSRINGVSLGTKARWYIDAFGDIAAYDETDSYETSMDYAYIIAAAVEGNIDKVCRVKLLKTDGTTAVYNCAGRIGIDGDAVKNVDAKAVYNKLVESGGGDIHQALRCGFNSSGEINRLDTLLEDKGGEYDKFSKDYTSPNVGDLPRYSQYANGIGVQKIEFLLNNDTKVFITPTVDGTEEDDEFTIGAASSFIHLNEYDLTAYDFSHTKVAGLVVIKEKKNKIGKQPEPAVVVSTSFGLAADESYKPLLKVWYRGKLESRIIADEKILEDREHVQDGKINDGDIIIFSEDENGEINSVWKYFNCGDAEYGYTDYKNGLISTNDWWFYANLRLTVGRIIEKDGDTILVSYGEDMNDASKQMPFLLKSSGRCAVYSKSKRALKQITKDDLDGYISSAGRDVKVLIATASGTPYDVVVFDDDAEF